MSTTLYEGDTKEVARRLIGCQLIHQTSEGTVRGRIVETEAYLANDPASHSYKGKRIRNEAMFGAPGSAYIYFIYGLHVCLNVVTATPGVGEAVLIRAVEPLEGLDLMQKRRGTDLIHNLCRGPARLTQAFAINLHQNGHSLNRPPLFIREEALRTDEHIQSSPRIGISRATEVPLRFYLEGNPFVSGSRSSRSNVNTPRFLHSS